MKKSIIGVSLVFIMFLCGCMTDEDRRVQVEELLEDKYNERFTVFRVDSYSHGGGSYDAYAYPDSNKEIIFSSLVNNEGSPFSDKYFKAYAEYQAYKVVQEDISQFFPGCYVRVGDIDLFWPDETKSFSNMDLEELIANSEIIGEGNVSLDIYIDKNAVNSKDFDKEYEYFTNKIDEYVNEGKMLPIASMFYIIDTDTIDKIENYFKTNTTSKHEYDELILDVPIYIECFSTNSGRVTRDQYINDRKEMDNVK